jgi:hypothetical protein
MGEIEKLALISDALDQLIPESKTTIILELSRKMFDEFNKKLNKDGLRMVNNLILIFLARIFILLCPRMSCKFSI